MGLYILRVASLLDIWSFLSAFLSVELTRDSLAGGHPLGGLSSFNRGNNLLTLTVTK